MAHRQIVLDTETTGISTADDHRIIEIGCVEMLDRKLTGNTFHQYLNPEREIDAGAIEVHGLTREFLADKPRFEDVVEGFLRFVEGAELIIHNAPFDTGFLNHELSRMQHAVRIDHHCSVIDTLKMARDKHPGQKNNLDALCRRYGVDNTNRTLHGALLDAEILAEVYLAMTGGQVSLSLAQVDHVDVQVANAQVQSTPLQTPVRFANAQELEAHEAFLAKIQEKSQGQCVWLAAFSTSDGKNIDPDS